MASALKRRCGAGLAGGLAALALQAGCGDSSGGGERSSFELSTDTVPNSKFDSGRASESVPSVEPARCPEGVAGCRSATGRVVYVERVDPDGDGDAHFVIVDRQSITLPGLTAIDLRAGLRPDPLPGPGDLVSAAGPVQTGSVGQSQIHALEFNVAAGG